MEIPIPGELCLDIFSRLPFDSLIQCKLVCKRWRALLKDPQLLMPTCLFSLSIGEHNTRAVYYGDYVYDTDGNEAAAAGAAAPPRFRVTKAPINDSKHDYANWVIIGSSQGLICSVSSDNHRSHEHIDVCVSNPCTGEYVDLPRIRVDLNSHFVAWGFGCHPSTKEFKVVAIICSVFDEERYVMVYTLGSGGCGVWRDKGYIHPLYNVWEYECSANQTWRGTLAEGSVHWIEKNEMKVVSFDLADEELRITPSEAIRTNTMRLSYRDKWRIISLPRRRSTSTRTVDNDEFITHFCELQVLGGCLSLVKHCHYSEKKVLHGTHGVWVKDSKDSWTKKLTPLWHNDHYKLLYLENNKVSILYSDVDYDNLRPGKMTICDLKTGRMEAMDIIRSQDHKDVFDNELVKSYEVFPYMKSFVSPKAL